MSITKENVALKEQEVIDAINSMIIDIHVPICEAIESIMSTRKKIGMKAKRIPVISVTINNKINEIASYFKSHDVSFYAVAMEEYDFVGASIIGEAIRDELIKYLFNASEMINNYIDIVDGVIDDNTNLLKRISKNKIKKFTLGIINHFKPELVDEILDYNREELNNADIYMASYVALDDAIYNYDVKKNIINALMEHFKRGEYYDESNIIYVVANYVIPDLIKLGLESLIPKLYEEILKTYGVIFQIDDNINIDFLNVENILTYYEEDDYTI